MSTLFKDINRFLCQWMVYAEMINDVVLLCYMLCQHGNVLLPLTNWSKVAHDIIMNHVNQWLLIGTLGTISITFDPNAFFIHGNEKFVSKLSANVSAPQCIDFTTISTYPRINKSILTTVVFQLNNILLPKPQCYSSHHRYSTIFHNQIT